MNALQDLSIRHGVASRMLDRWSEVERIRRTHPTHVLMFAVSLQEQAFPDPAGNRARGINYVMVLHGPTRQDAEVQSNSNLRSGVPRGWVEVGPFFGFIEPQEDLDTLRERVAAQEGCFIVTACYGDADATEVRMMRRFRDTVLRKTAFGRLFIVVYYAFSPPLARSIARSPRLRALVRNALVVPLIHLVVTRFTVTDDLGLNGST